MNFSSCLVIAMVFLGVESCKKLSAQLKENFVSVNKCQTLNTDGIKVTCCLDSVIQDSRCPQNVVCVWEGIAVARFTVNAQNTAHVFTLSTTTFEQYSRDTIVAGFKFEFINLLPRKEEDKPVKYKDYIAEVKISTF